MLELIKGSVKINLAYIDKVVIICSGRIEKTHQESIKQFMIWLDYKKYIKKFVFIYSKCDGKSDADKMNNLAYMCDILEADPETNTVHVVTGEVYNMNLALGFPPNAAYENIEDDHDKLIRAVKAAYPKERIPVSKSSCTIL